MEVAKTGNHPHERVYLAGSSSLGAQNKDNDAIFTVQIILDLTDPEVSRRLRDYGKPRLLGFVSTALGRLHHKLPPTRTELSISSPEFLDSGELAVSVHAGHPQDLKFLDNHAALPWTLSWTHALLDEAATEARLYKVYARKVTDMNTTSSEAAKEAIRNIVAANPSIFNSADDTHRISKICSDVVIITCVFAYQANLLMRDGLWWKGSIYECELSGMGDQKRLCGKCQAYGHRPRCCPKPTVCGKCAQNHTRADCTSKLKECASCHGPHSSNSANCPVNAAINHEIKQARYTTGTRVGHEADEQSTRTRSEIVSPTQPQDPRLILQQLTTIKADIERLQCNDPKNQGRILNDLT